MRVLLVDDNPQIRHLLARLVEERTGCVVVGEAENGLEGVNAMERLNPDIVILDVQMPVMGGLEAARKIKQERPGVHIVIYSSFLPEALDAQLVAIGVTAIVPKAETGELVYTLRKLEAGPTG